MYIVFFIKKLVAFNIIDLCEMCYYFLQSIIQMINIEMNYNISVNLEMDLYTDL